MTNAPEKSFGFQYEHNGKRCMCDLSAASKRTRRPVWPAWLALSAWARSASKQRNRATSALQWANLLRASGFVNRIIASLAEKDSSHTSTQPRYRCCDHAKYRRVAFSEFRNTARHKLVSFGTPSHYSNILGTGFAISIRVGADPLDFCQERRGGHL